MVAVAFSSAAARADAPKQAPRVVALATADDARKAIAIGPAGEVFEPDGKGAWVRKLRISTGNQIAHVGRASGAVIAFGEGVVYRLAPNGWSAIRLHQKQRAVMSAGARAVAAVGRQLFALDRSAGGEPLKLAVAPSNVLAIGANAANGLIVQTDRGLFRVEGAKVVAVKNAPRRVKQLVSDRWVLVDDGAIDLKTGRKTGWPPGVSIATAAVTADDRLVLVASQRGKLELVTLKQDKLERVPIALEPAAGGVAAPSLSPDARPVGVVVDKAGRAVIALDDGTLLVREGTQAWTATRVTEDLPGPKPGSPPAVSP
ncbi:MAG: hypothetical protein M4D80_42945 [Myxococcota bacterium]|nr:hypothetical protein [Myxococcota bacterium]